MNKQTVISSTTRVPIKWVFALLTSSGTALIVAMSAMLWLSGVANTASNAENNVMKVELKQEKLLETLQNIDRRLSNIEGALSVPRSRK